MSAVADAPGLIPPLTYVIVKRNPKGLFGFSVMGGADEDCLPSILVRYASVSR